MHESSSITQQSAEYALQRRVLLQYPVAKFLCPDILREQSQRIRGESVKEQGLLRDAYLGQALRAASVFAQLQPAQP